MDTLINKQIKYIECRTFESSLLSILRILVGIGLAYGLFIVYMQTDPTMATWSFWAGIALVLVILLAVRNVFRFAANWNGVIVDFGLGKSAIPEVFDFIRGSTKSE